MATNWRADSASKLFNLPHYDATKLTNSSVKPLWHFTCWLTAGATVTFLSQEGPPKYTVTTFLEDHNEIQPTKHSHSCTEIQRYEDILTLNGKYVGPGSRLLYTNQAISHLLTSEAESWYRDLEQYETETGQCSEWSSCRNKPPWRKVSHAMF